MSTSEEALGGGGAVKAADVEVMHGGKRCELVVAEAVAAMVEKRELSVAPFDRRAAALKQVGAFGGHLLNARLQGGRELLQRMNRLAKRFEQLLT